MYPQCYNLKHSMHTSVAVAVRVSCLVLFWSCMQVCCPWTPSARNIGKSVRSFEHTTCRQPQVWCKLREYAGDLGLPANHVLTCTISLYVMLDVSKYSSSAYSTNRHTFLLCAEDLGGSMKDEVLQ